MREEVQQIKNKIFEYPTLHPRLSDQILEEEIKVL